MNIKNSISWTIFIIASLCLIRNFNLLPTTPKNELSLYWVKDKDWSLRSDFLKNLATISKASIFIETGTFQGETTYKAAQHFNTVHTTELGWELFKKAENRFAYNPAIFTYYGNSPDILRKILPNIKGKIIFWLDAHYSSGETAKGKSNTPILEELKTIEESGIKDSIILIDDMRFLDIVENIPANKAAQGYPSIQQLRNALLNINPNYHFVVFSDIGIAYSPDEEFTVSPVVEACTISRLFENEKPNIPLVLAAEKQIAHAQNQERNLLLYLAEGFKHSEVTYQLGKHYRLWRGLVLAHEHQYKEALNQFLKARDLGLTHWRISWYIAKTAYKCRNKELLIKHQGGVEKATKFSRKAIQILQWLQTQNSK
ncbi:hypothetical protein E3J79_04530 [Candidatus Dependentiae bacterium]|nr:MAG: hypothetical protein E3J79_04530 [Candidatus Dependentiae bacterium]